jgi:hypothetical protein
MNGTSPNNRGAQAVSGGAVKRILWATAEVTPAAAEEEAAAVGMCPIVHPLQAILPTRRGFTKADHV